MSEYNPSVQTIGRADLNEGEVWAYYVDGFRRYIGTVKFHRYLDCKYLVHHKLGRGESDCILRTTHNANDLKASNMCKVCIKRAEKEKETK
ncbi:hypothetical protein [Bdellovibrio sp. BCCA]|uniref:hypothetical protein n=1 Tax=Bdellovibrio sp. BCCA TaxID=3136281 RepID=UPI0030F35731